MNKYQIVYHLLSAEGKKRIGGVRTFSLDKVITRKDHPALRKAALVMVGDRMREGDRVEIDRAYRVLDEGSPGAPFFIPPTTEELA